MGNYAGIENVKVIVDRTELTGVSNSYSFRFITFTGYSKNLVHVGVKGNVIMITSNISIFDRVVIAGENGVVYDNFTQLPNSVIVIPGKYNVTVGKYVFSVNVGGQSDGRWVLILFVVIMIVVGVYVEMKNRHHEFRHVPKTDLPTVRVLAYLQREFGCGNAKLTVVNESATEVVYSVENCDNVTEITVTRDGTVISVQ